MKNIIKEVSFILRDTSKNKIFFLVLCVVLTAIFEIMSVAFILPFISVIANPTVLETSTYFQKISNFFAINETTDFIILLGFSFLLLIIIGNLFSAFTAWLLTRFSFFIGYEIATKILKKYLAMPYALFFQRNTKELTKIIFFDVHRFVTGFIISGIQVATKFLFSIVIVVVLVITDPILAISSTIFLAGIYIIIYKGLKTNLTNAGKISTFANLKQHKAAGEALNGVKEIKVLGKETYFLEKFSKNAFIFAKAEAINTFSPMIVRYLLETIIFGGMLFVVLILYKKLGNITEMLPLLSLYAFAGYRLLPAMQQIFSGFSSVKFYRSSLNIIYSELKIKESEDQLGNNRNINFNHKLELKKVNYKYPTNYKYALDNINMNIQANTTVGWVGHTGSGKSTLADIILGLLNPTSGQLLVDNLEVNEQNIKDWQRKIGYVGQKIFLLDDTVQKNIALGINQENIDFLKIQEASKLAHIHEFIINDLPLGYETNIGEDGIKLSGGQRQRIGIARALYHDPSILIFDEATSALDNITENIVIQAINELKHKKTIIIIAHRISTIQNCDHIYIFQNGQITSQGNFNYLLENCEIFKKLAKVA